MKRETKEETISFALNQKMPLVIRKIVIRRPSDVRKPSAIANPFTVQGEAEANIKISEDVIRESQLAMTALDTLQNYSFQDDTHKEGVLTSLVDLVKALNPEDIESSFFPLLRYIPRESEKNKTLFLHRVPRIARALSQSQRLFEPFMDTLQFVLECLFEDAEEEIRKVACKTVSKLTPILKTEEERGQWMLTLILKLGHQGDNENSRKSAIELLNQLAPLFGADLAQSFIINELHGLADDPSPSVRNIIPLHLDRIAKIVSPSCFVNKLLDSVIHKLSNDKAWTVRRSVADEIAHLNAAAPNAEVRSQNILPLFEQLSQDSQKWVRTAILRQLGKFIASFPPAESNSPHLFSLLKQYAHIPIQCSTNSEADKEIVYQCAYTFPGVLYSFGPDIWEQLAPQHPTGLRDLHRKLIGTKRVLKIQKTLAASLHQVAKILGPKKAEAQILPIALNYLADSTNKGVRKLVFKYLPQLAATLPERAREKCLKPIEQTYASNINLDWRIRAVIAEQVEQYSLYFEPKIVESAIADILMQALYDTVASVRKAAARSTGTVLLQCLQDDSMNNKPKQEEERVSEQEEDKTLLSQKDDDNPFEEAKESQMKRGFPKFLLAMAAHPNFSARCVFVDICESIGRVLAAGNRPKLREKWENEFKQHLLELSTDKCYDVRLRLVRMLNTETYQKRLSEVLLSETELKSLLGKLAQDSGREIRMTVLQWGEG